MELTAPRSGTGCTAPRNTWKACSDTGCATEEATAAAFLTKPGKVSNLAAAARGRGLAVSWDAETGAASCKAQRKSGNPNRDAGNRQATTATTSASITSLGNGTQYTVRVAAALGRTPPLAPPRKRPLTVTNITGSGATLNIGNSMFQSENDTGRAGESRLCCTPAERRF